MIVNLKTDLFQALKARVASQMKGVHVFLKPYLLSVVGHCSYHPTTQPHPRVPSDRCWESFRYSCVPSLEEQRGEVAARASNVLHSYKTMAHYKIYK